jgi:arabinose-5-phosphate isomerase
MLIDTEHHLQGIFTDSDLARILEQRCEAELDQPVSTRMTTKFSAICSGAKLIDAIELMTRRKISELPVIDAQDRPVGMLDITDLLGLESQTAGESEPTDRRKAGEITSADSKIGGDDEWLDGPTTLRIFGPLK